MKKFYIIYKNSEVIEGQVNCKEEEFVKWFIYPCKESVYSYQIRDMEEEPKDDSMIVLEQLIRQL